MGKKTTPQTARTSGEEGGWVWCQARLRRLGELVRWHPVLDALVVAGALSGLVPWWLRALAAAAMVTGAVVWWRLSPEGFDRLVTQRLRAGWRRELIYRRRWRRVMALHGLVAVLDGRELSPRLCRVTSSRVGDVVSVRMVEGDEPLDWTQRASRLAHAFKAIECRVTHPKPQWVHLEFVFRRDIPEVPALAIAEHPDLDALPVGRQADGKLWRLPLLSVVHVLVCGVTGAGKGSVVWSLIRSVAAGVRDGWVQAWVADPKGGMELGHGPLDAEGVPECPMFTRFTTGADAIAEMLEDAVELMADRARRHAGRARKHTPTADEPAVLVIVDELAALTAFASDRQRERIGKALGLLLSQGRALGVHLVMAVQDPRKATIKVRDLIPYRIGLRMVDADHVDATLGQLAWVKGARCEDIPADAPGTGWVFLDGATEPTWVRAAWVSDEDIDQMATAYPSCWGWDPHTRQTCRNDANAEVVDLDTRRPGHQGPDGPGRGAEPEGKPTAAPERRPVGAY